VINTPYYKKIVIGPKDKYLIMATDGLWDVVDDKVKRKLCYFFKVFLREFLS